MGYWVEQVSNQQFLFQVVQQIHGMANLSQLNLLISRQHEATARGIAWLAAGCPETWSAAATISLALALF